MLYSFENYYFLFCFVLFLISMNIIGYIRNKAWYPMTSLFVFLASLIIHIMRRDELLDMFSYNVNIDFIGIGISITNLIMVDEIETRREIIKRVFENKYKKK